MRYDRGRGMKSMTSPRNFESLSSEAAFSLSSEFSHGSITLAWCCTAISPVKDKEERNS